MRLAVRLVPMAATLLSLAPSAAAAADPAGCHGGYFNFNQASASPGSSVSGYGECWLTSGAVVRLAWQSTGASVWSGVPAQDGSFAFSFVVPKSAGYEAVYGSQSDATHSLAYTGWIQVVAPPAPAHRPGPAPQPHQAPAPRVAAMQPRAAGSPAFAPSSLVPASQPRAVASRPAAAVHSSERGHEPAPAIAKPTALPTTPGAVAAHHTSLESLPIRENLATLVLGSLALVLLLACAVFLAVRRLPRPVPPIASEKG